MFDLFDLFADGILDQNDAEGLDQLAKAIHPSNSITITEANGIKRLTLNGLRYCIEMSQREIENCPDLFDECQRRLFMPSSCSYIWRSPRMLQ